LNRRIISSSVQFGESKVVGQPLKYEETGGFEEGELSHEQIYLKQKEQELKQRFDQMMETSKTQAQAILDDAKLQATQIIKEAGEEAAQIETIKQQALEEARQQGAQMGYDEGYQKAYQDVHLLVENIEAIADSTFKIKKEILLSSEQEILELSIVIAEKILKQQLKIKPEMITEVIKAAIGELKDKEEIKIIINPALKEQLYNFSEEMKATMKGLKTVKIIEDKTIHANSAIVESPESRIDARIDTQIAKITEELMKTFAQEPVIVETPEEELTKPKKASAKKTNKEKNDD